MRRGMFIIIIGILLLIISAAGWIAVDRGLIGGGGAEGEAEGPELPITIGTEEEATRVPQMTQIVVAVQDIPRGWEITEDTVVLWDWPADSLPPDAVVGSEADDMDDDGIPDAIEEILGQRMRTNAVRFEPMLTTMLADRIELEGTGSDAALAIPDGRVLIAYPLSSIQDDPTTAVAYALRPGDHIDMLISLALVDLDEEFHTELPNQILQLSVAEGEGGARDLTLNQFTAGRIEEGPLGLIFNVIPGEDAQRARVVTQLTVQDLVVVRVGRYPTYEEEIRGIDPQLPPTPTPVPEEGAEGPPPPPPPPPEPEVIVLAVTPQDALVINFAWKINADVDFALRAVGDRATYTTNSVTLQYLMETYNIAVPPKLEYGIDWPTYNLETFIGQ